MTNEAPLEYQCDNLVVGSSLEALLFAFYNKYKIIYTRRQMPHETEKFADPSILGESKLDAWNKHMFQLAIGGYVPFNNKIHHLRFCEQDTVKAITHDETVFTIKYKEIYIFDDHEFLDLPPSKESTSDEVQVLDYFQTLYINKHDRDPVTRRGKFMKNIIFQQNKDGTNSASKMLVISYIKKSELSEITENIVTIKLYAHIKEAGYELNKGKINPLITHVKRDIIDNSRNIYESFDNVYFMNTDPESVHYLYGRRRKIDYMKYFRIMLKVTNDRDEWR